MEHSSPTVPTPPHLTGSYLLFSTRLVIITFIFFIYCGSRFLVSRFGINYLLSGAFVIFKISDFFLSFYLKHPEISHCQNYSFLIIRLKYYMFNNFGTRTYFCYKYYVHCWLFAVHIHGIFHFYFNSLYILALSLHFFKILFSSTTYSIPEENVIKSTISLKRRIRCH